MSESPNTAQPPFMRRFWRLHNGTLSWQRFDAMLARLKKIEKARGAA